MQIFQVGVTFLSWLLYEELEDAIIILFIITNLLFQYLKPLDIVRSLVFHLFTLSFYWCHIVSNIVHILSKRFSKQYGVSYEKNFYFFYFKLIAIGTLIIIIFIHI